MSMYWTTASDRDFTLSQDEFGNYSHAADEPLVSFQEQKKILGERIKRLRLYREMTQEEAAEKTGINTTLWRHYEYGLKMPRQENLEKIAQTLDVPLQMLFPIDTCTPEGIATLLLNMQLQFGCMEIVEDNGSVSLKFPKNEFAEKATDTLKTVKGLLDKITWDDGIDVTVERFLCSRYAVSKEMGAEIKEKREIWKEILDGHMDESSLPEGEDWTYLKETAESLEAATYRLKNMVLLDYITEINAENKKKDKK